MNAHELQEFMNMLDEDDFAIGDTFWIGDIKFEVVDMTPEMKEQKGYTEEEKDTTFEYIHRSE